MVLHRGRDTVLTRLAIIFAQLALVVQADAAALAGDYAWPPVELTDADRREVARLEAMADQIHARALALGFAGGWPF